MRRRSIEIPIDDVADINLSPLIDMMFLLLIFFIVTTAFVEEVGVDIHRPEARTSVSLGKDSIMLGVTDDGRVVYGDKEIGVSGVRALVSRLREGKKRPVIILADKDSRSGVLVDVIDECRAAGADKISVATERNQ